MSVVYFLLGVIAGMILHAIATVLVIKKVLKNENRRMD